MMVQLRFQQIVSRRATDRRRSHTLHVVYHTLTVGLPISTNTASLQTEMLHAHNAPWGRFPTPGDVFPQWHESRMRLTDVDRPVSKIRFD